jgi:hypothetical protein
MTNGKCWEGVEGNRTSHATEVPFDTRRGPTFAGTVAFRLPASRVSNYILIWPFHLLAMDMSPYHPFQTMQLRESLPKDTLVA